jgi:hypothetical protein
VIRTATRGAVAAATAQCEHGIAITNVRRLTFLCHPEHSEGSRALRAYLCNTALARAAFFKE